MSNIRTLNSTNNKSSQNDWRNTPGSKLQEEMLTDDQDCGTSTGNKRKTSFNKNTINPQDLRNNDVCSLYEEYLQDLEEEDREACIEKLKVEKITGRTLVRACNDSKVMTDLIEKLKLPLDYKLRFDEMLKFIKHRDNDIKKGTNENNENNENMQAAEIPAFDGINVPKGNLQNISNAKSVVGAVYNLGHNQEISTACHYYGETKKKSG